MIKHNGDVYVRAVEERDDLETAVADIQTAIEFMAKASKELDDKAKRGRAIERIRNMARTLIEDIKVTQNKK